MISLVNGIVAAKSLKSLTVEIGGVGLEIFVSAETANSVREGEKIRLLTYLHVKEDGLTLFGFLASAERDFFGLLLKVSGVGPKTAMEIMETPLGQIKKAILEENAVALAQTKGLGKKTAQKIILELKSKIEDEDLSDIPLASLTAYDEDAVFALQNLGFRRREVFDKLKSLPPEITKTEEIIKWFLRKA